jgi:hypothetical protein
MTGDTSGAGTDNPTDGPEFTPHLLLVRKDMDVHEHERLSNITLR